jgi:hypothetical protein
MPPQQWRTAIDHIKYLENYVLSNTVHSNDGGVR